MGRMGMQSRIAEGGQIAEQAAPRLSDASPRPWTLTPQGYISPNKSDPFALLKLKSPWIEGAWDEDKEAAANAAFIVRACNSHEALVKALEAVDSLWSRDALNFEFEMGFDSPVGKVWAELRAALASAREVQP